MPIRPEQIEEAASVQNDAGRDSSSQVRLVAGPGTGKSFTLEERVRWLLERGVLPQSIVGVSFTRASAFDLRGRVHGYCLTHGHPEGADVAISTLHSLALRTLRRAGALGAYPADPLVLDEWELRNIFDAEFGREAGIGSITRREEIRRDHEALWSTGTYDPPSLVPPVPPITPDERAKFAAFHRPRTQTYSCVLPGEIIRKCVEMMEAGTLDPVDLLEIEHVIVDEFQDLNPMDLEFIHRLADSGATLFVAGDDDQSLYSFRFASPAGIQRFTERFPEAGDHALEACFRCTPSVVTAARNVIEANPMEQRIPKDLLSLYANADPPLDGSVECWRFSTDRYEADAIALSCARLLDDDVPARQILILLSNQRAQGTALFRVLEAAAVPFEPPRAKSFRDTDAGRLVLALVRIAKEPHDYVAHRTILGLRRGVGVGTCSDIARAVVSENLNFRELFYSPLPEDVFSPRASDAITGAADVVEEAISWGTEETIEERDDDIRAVLVEVLGEDAATDWADYVDALPTFMNLEELRSYLLLDKDEQQAELLIDVYRRIEQEPPEDVLPPKVRVLSMHGAKGLSAQIVFIPGLEEEILPGPRRSPYPGLVLEAARMLYVSITRARLACIVSYASRRFMNGQMRSHHASRFTTDIGQAFVYREEGLSEAEAAFLAEQASFL